MSRQFRQSVRPTLKRASAREVLGKVGLESKADRYPRQLSGRQQQRVAIARARRRHRRCIDERKVVEIARPETFFTSPSSARAQDFLDKIL